MSDDFTTLSLKVDRLGDDFTTLSVKVDRLGGDFNILTAKVDKLEDEVRGLRWWIAGAAIGVTALSLGVIQLQAGWFQKTIDAYQKVSEARMDEFRRDSDRNYELAIKALERSVAQAHAPQAPPPSQQ